MPSALLLESLVAARTHDRLEQADARRLRNRARRSQRVQSRSGWRHRTGWRLVEIGLRLAATDPVPAPTSGCA